MDLTLTEDQQLIQQAAREFFQSECPMGLVREMAKDPRGYSQELWKQMAELGYMGLSFPEEYGGMGCNFLDLCVLIEELGRFRVPGPFLCGVVLCGLPIARFGSEEQKSQYLAGIADGQRVMSYAETESGASWASSRIQLAAVASDDGYVLDGEKLFVPYAHAADTLLVAVRTQGTDQQGITLLLVDSKTPGITYEPLDTIDHDHQQKVTFRNVTVPARSVLGQVGEGDRIVAAIHQWGVAAKCAEMVGGAERVLELSVDYAKTRTQFDRPIGSFQAVQHHCANMAVDVASSRFIAYEAIWRLSEGLDASKEVSMAKAWVSDAYQRVCAAGHQIHGAIGFTEEHDMHLYFRHARASELAFGDGDYHREQLCQQLGF
jgi:alkylation response protein AidB-like acyl-CoA dehydrogenase